MLAKPLANYWNGNAWNLPVTFIDLKAPPRQIPYLPLSHTHPRPPLHAALCPCSHVQAGRRAHFFDDAVLAFPELELFFVQSENSTASSGLSGADEYQRTMGALFAV